MKRIPYLPNIAKRMHIFAAAAVVLLGAELAVAQSETSGGANGESKSTVNAMWNATQDSQTHAANQPQTRRSMENSPISMSGNAGSSGSAGATRNPANGGEANSADSTMYGDDSATPAKKHERHHKKSSTMTETNSTTPTPTSTPDNSGSTSQK